MTSPVNAAVAQALSDAGEAYVANGVEVHADLQATVDVPDPAGALHTALYTLFRALPRRLAPGSRLTVTTVDRPGGDVELAWQAVERVDASVERTMREHLGDGPHGDLLALAIRALEDHCRTRTVHVPMDDGSTRALALIPGRRSLPPGALR